MQGVWYRWAVTTVDTLQVHPPATWLQYCSVPASSLLAVLCMLCCRLADLHSWLYATHLCYSVSR